jgi:gamma-butyrobetaine dioxygenase
VTTQADADVVAGVAFLPERVGVDDVSSARELLARDGAVTLTGSPVEPDALVRVAATVLGTRLRHLEDVRSRTTESGGELPLHTDGINVVVDIHGRHTQQRDHDIDFVLVLCDTPAPVGGESVTVDGYRLVDRIRQHRPELHEFMTTVDVDFTSGVRELEAHRQPLRACRMIEWTRGGRMVLRAYPWAVPLPMDPLRDEHQHRLNEYADVLTALFVAAPHYRLGRGEIQLLDSYRCPHGVRAHHGTRRTHVLSCKSTAAL